MTNEQVPSAAGPGADAPGPDERGTEARGSDAAGAATAGWPATARVDHEALAHNLRVLRDRARGADALTVVKADAYGHGLLPVARTMLRSGATLLGVAQLAEALTLRAGLGGRGRILAWLYAPGAPLADALDADIEIGISAPWMLDELLAAVRATGRVATVHLKLDTGMARNGYAPAQVDDLAARLGPAVAEGALRVGSTFSHLASADEPASGTTERQTALFLELVGRLRSAGVDPGPLHLAASSGVLLHPATHLDMIRPGIALYGVSPAEDVIPAADHDLRPAMTVSGRLVLTRESPEGTPVGYGHTARTERDTVLGLVPLGYADGVPRAASNQVALSVAGRRVNQVGRVSMDQVVVDLGPGATDRPGDEVVLFGDPARGEPSAWEWALASGTIAYETLTSVGVRVPRVHVGATRGVDDAAGTHGEVSPR
ncbi:alanine racemase [Georgenia sp. Z1491]|uniref:alanine racemase n=1 Tax=Georgenia sp. Z1491 TaxID=3416707 RepID=UPI003CF6C144